MKLHLNTQKSQDGTLKRLVEDSQEIAPASLPPWEMILINLSDSELEYWD